MSCLICLEVNDEILVNLHDGDQWNHGVHPSCLSFYAKTSINIMISCPLCGVPIRYFQKILRNFLVENEMNFSNIVTCRSTVEMLCRLDVPFEGILSPLFGDDALIVLPEKGSECDIIFRDCFYKLLNEKDLTEMFFRGWFSLADFYARYDDVDNFMRNFYNTIISDICIFYCLQSVAIFDIFQHNFRSRIPEKYVRFYSINVKPHPEVIKKLLDSPHNYFQKKLDETSTFRRGPYVWS